MTNLTPLAALICLLWVLPGWSQELSAPGAGGNCSLYGTDDATRGSPVIFGKQFAVPALRFRFLDKKTGRPFVPKMVNVHYLWLWIEHPYPEHDWGAWSDAEDWVQCSSKTQDDLIVPARTIQPRGWYSGRYTFFPWRQPKFDRLEIVIEHGQGCGPILTVKARDLDRFRDATAILKVPCAGFLPGFVDVDFERRSK